MPTTKHRAKLGLIRIKTDATSGAKIFAQAGGRQSAVDASGVSVETYVHALFSLVMQSGAKKVLMIGCAGGTLATMLHNMNVAVTVVDIDKSVFAIARKNFNMPRAVHCHAGDGLKFMQRTRATFDAVIIDAFIGENVPPQFLGDAFCVAARRVTKRSGVVLVNVCLDGLRDTTADDLAARMASHGWRTRLIDERGPMRNAIVVAGRVQRLRPPRLLMPPCIRAKKIARALTFMRFRPLRPSAQIITLSQWRPTWKK